MSGKARAINKATSAFEGDAKGINASKKLNTNTPRMPQFATNELKSGNTRLRDTNVVLIFV